LVNSRELGGLVEFANETHLAVTLHKTRNAPEHMYRDQIDGDRLLWESPAQHTEKRLEVRKLLSGAKPVRFFCRIRDRDPFVYCGLLKYISHAGSAPVAFVWRLVDHASLKPLETFQRVASWRPVSTDAPQPPPVSEATAFSEGLATKVTVNRYERDDAARSACLAAHGYKCWVCGFDFRAVYGSLGDRFSFVHHRRPIAKRATKGPYQPDPARDLVPICGNCHVMVHRGARGSDEPSPGSLELSSWRRLLELRAEARGDEWDRS
jgi:hypothetical protein